MVALRASKAGLARAGATIRDRLQTLSRPHADGCHRARIAAQRLARPAAAASERAADRADSTRPTAGRDDDIDATHRCHPGRARTCAKCRRAVRHRGRVAEAAWHGSPRARRRWCADLRRAGAPTGRGCVGGAVASGTVPPQRRINSPNRSGRRCTVDAPAPDHPPVPRTRHRCRNQRSASSPLAVVRCLGLRVRSGCPPCPAIFRPSPSDRSRPASRARWSHRRASLTSMPVAVPDPSPASTPMTPTPRPRRLRHPAASSGSGSSLGSDPSPSIEGSPLVGTHPHRAPHRRAAARAAGKHGAGRRRVRPPRVHNHQQLPPATPGSLRLPHTAVSRATAAAAGARGRSRIAPPGRSPRSMSRPAAVRDATVSTVLAAAGRQDPSPAARRLATVDPAPRRGADCCRAALRQTRSQRRLAPVPATDPEPVPVRWGPVAHAGVQRAPEGVPADLRAELEPVLGTPLADVKVHRDADTGEAARQLSAKAFTAGGEVFLPDWHGPTTGGEARSILTHELTHVAQQRRLGPALPDEASSAGTALESEAQAVAEQGPAGAGPARRIEPFDERAAAAGRRGAVAAGARVGVPFERAECRPLTWRPRCRRRPPRPASRRLRRAPADPTIPTDTEHRSHDRSTAAADRRLAPGRVSCSGSPTRAARARSRRPRRRPKLHPTIRHSSTSSPGASIHDSEPVSARTCSPTASAPADSSTSGDVTGCDQERDQGRLK